MLALSATFHGPALDDSHVDHVDRVDRVDRVYLLNYFADCRLSIPGYSQFAAVCFLLYAYDNNVTVFLPEPTVGVFLHFGFGQPPCLKLLSVSALFLVLRSWHPPFLQ